MDIDSAGVGSIPGPRVSATASSLHVPAVSPVWRRVLGWLSMRSACSGWPDRARVASNGRLRARMPGDQSASRPGHTLLSRGNGEGGGAGLLWTSIPPGWVPSLVRGYPRPNLLCTSQQSLRFGERPSSAGAFGQAVRGGLTGRGWQAMQACGQGCPRTKVPRESSRSRFGEAPPLISQPGLVRQGEASLRI